MDEDGIPHLEAGLAMAFAAIMAGGILDLWFDGVESWLSLHALFEVTMIAVSLGLAVFLWRRWAVTAKALGKVYRSLEWREAQHEEWKNRARAALDGLGQAIDAQFSAWGLTPVERDTALGLLKGFSHKRIALDREGSERTVRQHAISVYKKAGVSGRAELAAFFLQDLVLPSEDEADGSGDSGDPSDVINL